MTGRHRRPRVTRKVLKGVLAATGNVLAAAREDWAPSVWEGATRADEWARAMLEWLDRSEVAPPDGARCARLLARRRGLRPDLPCGLPAKAVRDGRAVCGRCRVVLDRQAEARAEQEAPFPRSTMPRPGGGR